MSRWRVLGRLLAGVLAVLGCCSSLAAEVSRDPAHHRQRLEQVQNATREQYQATLQWYDNYLANRRYDVVAAVERCRFIGVLALDFEYLEWLDEVYDDKKACDEALAARYPLHPEVQLYELENKFGEQLREQGERLLETSAAGEWTEGQLGRLYTLLAGAHEQSDQSRATELALQALAKDRLRRFLPACERRDFRCANSLAESLPAALSAGAPAVNHDRLVPLRRLRVFAAGS